MKRADIKIGTEYAYADSVDYGYRMGRATRVRVTGFGPFSTWRGKTQTGAEVEHLGANGEVVSTSTVATRTIHEEWAPYAERRDADRKARRASDAARRKAQDERAASLLDIIPALRHAGIPDSRGYSYDDRVLDLIGTHTPEIFVLNDGDGRASHFVGPLAESYGSYIKSGASFTIKAELLLAALR